MTSTLDRIFQVSSLIVFSLGIVLYSSSVQAQSVDSTTRNRHQAMTREFKREVKSKFDRQDVRANAGLCIQACAFAAAYAQVTCHAKACKACGFPQGVRCVEFKSFGYGVGSGFACAVWCAGGAFPVGQRFCPINGCGIARTYSDIESKADANCPVPVPTETPAEPTVNPQPSVAPPESKLTPVSKPT